VYFVNLCCTVSVFFNITAIIVIPNRWTVLKYGSNKNNKCQKQQVVTFGSKTRRTRLPANLRPPVRPSVFRLLTGPYESLPRGGVWWERDEQGLEGDTQWRQTRPERLRQARMVWIARRQLPPGLPASAVEGNGEGYRWASRRVNRDQWTATIPGHF